MDKDHIYTPETYVPPALTVVGNIEELTKTGGHHGHLGGSVTDGGGGQRPSGCFFHRGSPKNWCILCAFAAGR
jgi:hypothetical protein